MQSCVLCIVYCIALAFVGKCISKVLPINGAKLGVFTNRQTYYRSLRSPWILVFFVVVVHISILQYGWCCCCCCCWWYFLFHLKQNRRLRFVCVCLMAIVVALSHSISSSLKPIEALDKSCWQDSKRTFITELHIYFVVYFHLRCFFFSFIRSITATHPLCLVFLSFFSSFAFWWFSYTNATS